MGPQFWKQIYKRKEGQLCHRKTIGYQERFGYDYDEWEKEAKYNALRDELSRRGYVLPWDVDKDGNY